MRRGLALVFVLVGGCYAAPDPGGSCTILCTDSCPGDLTCTNGYCVGAGQVCAPEYRQVAAGGGFGCALDARDRLWCWGTNARHQIDGTPTPGYPRASLVGTGTWQTIAAGGAQTCGISDGALSCWGANDRGQITGSILGDVPQPFTIAAPGGGAWTSVATGYQTTCGIAGGHLYCWGAGDKGVLGNGTTTDGGLPTEVMSTLTDWTTVSIGFGLDNSKLPRTHACAISASTGLWCWGGNDTSELGNGTTTASSVPVQVTLPSPPTSVAAATNSTCATTEDQRLLCWGNNPNGQVGDPVLVTTFGVFPTPIPATLLTGWTRVVAAEQMVCGLRMDEVWCWGLSNSGGMGNGVWASSKTFSRVAIGATDLSVAPNTDIDDSNADTADLDLACAVIGGNVVCWGTNQFGQLAQGATTQSPRPVEVVGTHHWTALAAGSSHVCGVADDQLLCWGSTVSGQANGVPSGNANVPCGSLPGLACDVSVPTPIAIATNVRTLSLGFAHSCVLGDALWCWGDDSQYQLGGQGLGPAPVEVTGPWSSLFQLRGYGACAVTAGETRCWGAAINNAQATVHVPELDGMTAISTSTLIGSSWPVAFGCSLDATQQLVCFGGNTFGQYGNGLVGSPSCPNGACDAGETAATCPSDCGAGPLTKLGRHYRAISVGFGSTSSGGTACGVTTTTGQVECWGRNRSGVAGVIDGGTGLPPADVFTATPLANLTGCTQVSVGDNMACALCGGDVSCWGDHRRGAVGAGPVTATPIAVPRKVDVDLGGDTFAQVAVGQGFACARTTAGRLFCWGSSIHGALGTGVTGANLPTPILR